MFLGLPPSTGHSGERTEGLGRIARFGEQSCLDASSTDLAPERREALLELRDGGFSRSLESGKQPPAERSRRGANSRLPASRLCPRANCCTRTEWCKSVPRECPTSLPPARAASLCLPRFRPAARNKCPKACERSSR